MHGNKLSIFLSLTKKFLTMPITKITRDEILDIAEKIFRERGYHNTSMKDIADSCGLFKGSLYHHFDSKEVMMKAVLKRNHQVVKETILSIADNDEIDALGRLKKMFDKYSEKIENQPGGCIMGNTALETGYTEDFKPLLRAFFDDWVTAFDKIFSDKYPPEKSKSFATSCVQLIEGAFMFYKIYKDKSVIESTKNTALSFLG